MILVNIKIKEGSIMRILIVAWGVSLILSVLAVGVGAESVKPLVSTGWVAERLDIIKNPDQTEIRLVDISKKAYAEGHIPGAVHLKWDDEVFDLETDHMVLGLAEIERVLRKLGITPDTYIVLYDGDGSHHHVTRVYWTLKYWNLDKVSIMDGGKFLWEKEKRPITKDIPNVKPRHLEVKYPPNIKIRARYSPEMIKALATGDSIIIDGRTEKFFKGEVYSLDKWVRSGHIPGAINVFTLDAMTKDKTYRSVDELKKIYEGKGVTPDKKVITYCDTGVLGTHAWFVLSELLGYKNVSVYDGSMREWANRFDTPMEPGVVGGKFPKTPIQKLEEKLK